MNEIVKRLEHRSRTMNGANRPVGASDGQTYTLASYDSECAKDDMIAAAQIRSLEIANARLRSSLATAREDVLRETEAKVLLCLKDTDADEKTVNLCVETVRAPQHKETEDEG